MMSKGVAEQGGNIGEKAQEKKCRVYVGFMDFKKLD